MKRLLAFAVGFALATFAEAGLRVTQAHAQTYNRIATSIGYMHPGLAPIWSGFYIGGHLGGAWTSIGVSDAPGSLDANGVIGGLHAGYNFHTSSSSMLLGLEADGSWSGADYELRDGTVTANASLPWLASLRGRVGLVHDTWLLYLTGGFAFGELKVSLRDTDPAFPLDVTGSKTSTGYVIGGGIEKKFSQRFSGRGEILHYGFGDFGTVDGAGKLEVDATVVRAGLSVHMN